MPREADSSNDEDVRLQLAEFRDAIDARPGFRDRLYRRLSQAHTDPPQRTGAGRPQWRLRLAGFAVAAVAVAVVVVVISLRGGAGPAAPVVGEAVVEEGSATVGRGSEVLELSTGSRIALRTGDEIQTGRDAGVSVSLDDGDVLVLFEETSATVTVESLAAEGSPPSTEIELGEGVVRVDLRPNRDREFTLTTPLARVSAEGTTFDVLVSNPARTVVVVEEGIVAVEAEQGSARLSAQEQVDVRFGEPLVVSKGASSQAVTEGSIVRFLVLPPSQQQGDSSAGVLGPLPPGAAFDAGSATFSWIPDYDQAGSYPVTFVVCLEGKCAEQTIDLEVLDTDRPPQLEPLGDREVSVGTILQLQLQASDPDEDVLIFLIEGERPQGAELDARTGVLTWTPSEEQAGSWSLTVAACDQSPLCATMTVNITVES